MNYEERNKTSRGYLQFRASLHIGMGAFYIVIGSLVLYVKHFGAMELPSGIAYPLGIMMLLYGIFRIWRGIAGMRQVPRRNIERDFPSLRQEKPEK